MATKKSGTTFVGVDALKHSDDKRKNIPTAEYQSLMADEARKPVQVSYARGTSNADGLQAEKQQRNRDIDPQLVWRGKDDQDWTDLVVNAPPLYIQEKVHPKVLIDDLQQQTRARREGAAGGTVDMFGDFNGIPAGADKTDFYAHDQNWTNRMILGDSLQVMASLAEREGLRGKVQCVYLDPPYGIKFNSNFQWSTTSRDVKDGNRDHISREPEQVKAFRDTWRDGINSYLTYLARPADGGARSADRKWIGFCADRRRKRSPRSGAHGRSIRRRQLRQPRSSSRRRGAVHDGRLQRRLRRQRLHSLVRARTMQLGEVPQPYSLRRETHDRRDGCVQRA